MENFIKKSSNKLKEMAANLYGTKTHDEEEKKKTRNSLLNDLEGKLTPAQILYSPVEKLQKIKDELLNEKDSTHSNSFMSEEPVNKLTFDNKKENQTSTGILNDRNDKDDLSDKKDLRENSDNKNYVDDIRGVLTGGIEYTKEGLEKRADEIRKEKFEKDVNIKKTELKIAKNTGNIGRLAVSTIGGPDTAGMLNIASKKIIPLYKKDVFELNNINDKKVEEYNNSNLAKWKPYMEQKIKDQFKDFNYDLKDIKGYVFKSNSAPVKRIKKSEDFKDILKNNKEAILEGKRFTGRFANHGINRESNLHNAFGSVDFLNSGIDKEGNLHLYMFDTYDFNKGENANVEAGRRMMPEGKLKDFSVFMR